MVVVEMSVIVDLDDEVRLGYWKKTSTHFKYNID